MARGIGRARAALAGRGRAGSGDDLRRPRGGRRGHAEDAPPHRARPADHRRGRVRGRGRAAAAARAGGRREDLHRREGVRRAHAEGAPGVRARRRRVALRPRPAPGPPPRRRRARPRPVAAQPGDRHPLPRVDAALGAALGQPGAHALRPPGGREAAALLGRGGRRRGARALHRLLLLGPRPEPAARRAAAVRAHGAAGVRTRDRGLRRAAHLVRPGQPAPRDRPDLSLRALDGLSLRPPHRRVLALRGRRPRRGPAVDRRPSGHRLLEPVPPGDRRRAAAPRVGAAARVPPGVEAQRRGEHPGPRVAAPARGTAADLAVVGLGRGHRLRLRARHDPRRRDRRLPGADGARGAAAPLGARLLAEPRAVQDGGRAPRHGEGVPRAPLPARRDRAGLALLAGRRVGLARLRPRPLPRPEGHDRRDPRPRGEGDDLGLAQVLPG